MYTRYTLVEWVVINVLVCARIKYKLNNNTGLYSHNLGQPLVVKEIGDLSYTRHCNVYLRIFIGL